MESVAARRRASAPIAAQRSSSRLSAATSLLADIHQAMPQDAVYQAWLKKRPSELQAEGLRIERSYLYRGDRLYLPADAALKTRLLQECHDAPSGGHLGKAKTIEQVKRRFYWPRMDAEIAQYVTSCDSCQRNKPSQQAKIGLLQPLPVPERPWQWVSLDLITQLPRSRAGHDAIVVFVDKLTKMVHYVPTTTNVTAPQLATIFVREVCRLHGVPDAILSDRDPRFTAHFWRALWKQLGTTLTMSTAYHPQTDGQTERANRTLEEMLRHYVDWRQHDWDEYLSVLELAFNNAQQASTGFSPFFLNYGQEVRLPLDAAMREARAACKNPEAAQRIEQLQQSLDVRQGRHSEGAGAPGPVRRSAPSRRAVRRGRSGAAVDRAPEAAGRSSHAQVQRQVHWPVPGEASRRRQRLRARAAAAAADPSGAERQSPAGLPRASSGYVRAATAAAPATSA